MSRIITDFSEIHNIMLKMKGRELEGCCLKLSYEKKEIPGKLLMINNEDNEIIFYYNKFHNDCNKCTVSKKLFLNSRKRGFYIEYVKLPY